MVNYTSADLFLRDSVNKQLLIALSDGTNITNADLWSENFELNESICSEETLVFGSCEASSVRFRVRNDVNIGKGQEFTISATLDGGSEPFYFGKYKVFSCIPTADRSYKEVTAYDRLYDVINADVSDWYNGLFTDATTLVTLKGLRDSFFSHFGIEQEVIALPNDGAFISKTISATELSGQTVVSAICEANGCFGHIGRDGRFKYIFLSDTDRYEIESQHYMSAEYEDFEYQLINKLQIRTNEDDIGYTYGTGDNCYVIQDNFLFYGMTIDELAPIAQKIYEKISSVTYRPCSINAVGFPCLEVGDAIAVNTTYQRISSYILQRTLSGIQALKDVYTANGEEFITAKVNGIANQFNALKVRTNTLERTLDGTVSKVTEIDGNYVRESEFTQTVEGINAQITSIEGEIDGSIVVYNVTETPTLENYPAWDFTLSIPVNDTVQLGDGVPFEYKREWYSKFLRSVAFDEENLLTYKFARDKDTGNFYWQPETDTEFGIAMEKIASLEVSVDGISTEVGVVKESYQKKSDMDIYSTTEEMTSAISQSAQEITQTVSSTYQTKSAMNNYSTTQQMNSAISQSAQGITQSVSETYQTKSGMSAYQTTAGMSGYQTKAGMDSYSTTVEMNSSIEQSASSIKQTVAQYSDDWDSTGYSISVYGYGNADTKAYPPSSYNGKYYLNRINGALYLSNGSSWNYVKTLTKSQTSFNSKIEQTVESINISVDNSKGSATIKVSIKDPVSGKVTEKSSNVSINANTISLSASDVINLLTNGTINLTSKNISITSDKFSVDRYGNASAEGLFAREGIILANKTNNTPYIDFEKQPSGNNRGERIVRIFAIEEGNERFLRFYGKTDSEFAHLSSASLTTTWVNAGQLYENGNRVAVQDGSVYALACPSANQLVFRKVGDPNAYYVSGSIFSDTRLKENIADSEVDALSVVEQIRPIQFDWKKDGSHVDLGFSANQLEEIIPEAVVDVDQPEENEFDSLKQIDASALTIYLVKAIQELSAQNKRLEKRIEELEGK